MKRFIIISILFQLISGSASAQHENAVLVKSDTIRGSVLDEVATGLNGEIVDNSKDPRARYDWFVDAAIGGGFYAAELNRFQNNFLTRMRTSAQVSVAKWVLPHWAVRFALGYGKFAGNYTLENMYWNYFDQVDHKTMPEEAKEYFYPDANGEPIFHRKFDMIDAEVNLIYDFNRLFTKRKTPFDTYIYGGVGYSTVFASQGIGWHSSLSFKAGLDVHVNVSDKFYVKTAIEGTICDESLDGVIAGLSRNTNRTVEGYAQCFIGVGFNFGGKKTHTYTYTGTDNIERTYKIVNDAVVEDYSAPFVVRFFIDQYNIEQDQELNIAKVCRYLQSHPNARLLMTGHCDPETANPKYNQALSERRCNSVLKYIDKHYGISHSRIDVKPMGDTQRNFDEDFRWNRCVILTIIDK